MDQLDKLQKERAQDDEELRKLSDTLTSYLDRPISPPSSPFYPEDTAEELQDNFTELIRNSLKPHIENLRTELAAEIQKHDLEAYNMLTPKLQSTQKVMNSISKTVL